MLTPRPLAIAAVALLAAATRASAQSPSASATGASIDGISCDAQEGQRMHIHQHLVILDHGKPVAIPQNIGQPAGRRCIYWLHTHTPDGIIHIEAPKERSFTLGDFFKVWGQPIDKTQAGGARADKGASLQVWVDGKRFTGNPAAIALTAHRDIVIEAGPPFSKPARFTNWGSL